MDKKPNVFPNSGSKKPNDENFATYGSEKYDEETKLITREVFEKSSSDDLPTGQLSALEQMKKRTEEQLRMRDESGVVIESEFAEKQIEKQAVISYGKATENHSQNQLDLRDQQLERNKIMIEKYQKQLDDAMNRELPLEEIKPKNMQEREPEPFREPIAKNIESFGKNPSSIDPNIVSLSQPNYNSPFDVIPLPSEGKIYKNKKPSVRLSYMTTSDENILTSPNLLESGEFLEILINRKLLEEGLRYRDLHVGDRNAIMIWLRATGYGEMYPVTMLDEKDEPFDIDIDLNNLNYKKLGAEPDSEGLFDYEMKLSKTQIKFRFLNCGDIDDISKIVDAETKQGGLVNNTSIYSLDRMIVEVNGSRDRNVIRQFVRSIRLLEGKEFTKYVEEIESGVDLNITVGTPGGGSIETFLPLNLRFFWPDL